MDEMNFQNPEFFFGFGLPAFGVVDIWWVETPKVTPSSVPLVCRKSFPVRPRAGYRKFRLLLWLRPR